MTEAEVTELFRDELRRRGYKVLKHCDRITVGIPDTSASRNHKTVWFEFKAKRLTAGAAWPEAVLWETVLSVTKSWKVQLANMVALEEKAVAFYVLFLLKPREHRMALALPSTVRRSVAENRPFNVGAVTTLKEMGEWV